MAKLSDLVPEGTVAENEQGQIAVFRNGRWNLGGDPQAVPINRNAPGAAFLPKMRQPGSKSEEAYYRDFRQKDNPRISQAREGLNIAREMEALLAKQETGGRYGLPFGIGSAFRAWDSSRDPEVSAMEALQAKRARQNRQPGEGAISDFDAQQFLNMTYGLDKPTETNRQLVRAQRLADDSAIQRRQFAEWYYNSFGALTGAEEAWDRYAQDNPIFSPGSGDVVGGKFNEGRKNWREYFGDVRGQADTRPTAAYEDLRRSSPNTQPSRLPRINKGPPAITMRRLP